MVYSLLESSPRVLVQGLGRFRVNRSEAQISGNRFLAGRTPRLCNASECWTSSLGLKTDSLGVWRHAKLQNLSLLPRPQILKGFSISARLQINLHVYGRNSFAIKVVQGRSRATLTSAVLIVASTITFELVGAKRNKPCKALCLRPQCLSHKSESLKP